MKKKVLAVVLTAVLTLSLGLVMAGPVGALDGECWEDVWMIGDVEPTQMDHPCNEFNYPTVLSGDKDFKIGDPISSFPWISRYSPNYARTINIDFNASMPDGGRLSFSWSPGGSGRETLDVKIDSNLIDTITMTGTANPAWWGSYERFVWTYDIDPLDPGVHTVTFTLRSGDGSVWDWIKLEQPCGEIEVYVDIKPTSCPNPFNLKSKGVLPVAILGTGDFDVNEIDPASVELGFGPGSDPFDGGVPAEKSAYEDVETPYDNECSLCSEAGPDGYLDLTLKFSKEDIIDRLLEIGLYPTDGECVLVAIGGELYDGTAFIGYDYVRIINKGQNGFGPQNIDLSQGNSNGKGPKNK